MAHQFTLNNHFILRFEEGMPKGTAQQKGECVRYKFVGDKKVPYIHHFKKASVSGVRNILEWKLKPYRPERPVEGSVRLFVVFYFDVKERSKWGKYKPTRADLDNLVKECIDAMVSAGFFKDDSLIVDLHAKKYYAEKASIFIDWEEIT